MTMTALDFLAAMPRHLVLLLADFTGLPDPDRDECIQQPSRRLFGAGMGLLPEALPGYELIASEAYGDYG